MMYTSALAGAVATYPVATDPAADDEIVNKLVKTHSRKILIAAAQGAVAEETENKLTDFKAQARNAFTNPLARMRNMVAKGAENLAQKMNQPKEAPGAAAAAGGKSRKKHSKRHRKKHSKRHRKKHTKKHTKKHSKSYKKSHKHRK